MLDNIKIEIIDITPEKAGQFLAKNKNFRSLNERRAEHIAEQIKLGRWQLNGESIKIDEKGNLVDGQHRLRGCVLAGVNIKSVVAFGVDDTNVDTGSARTLAQLLNSHGYMYAAQLSSTANFVFRYQNFGSFYTNDYVSRDDILQLMEKNKRLLDAVQFTTKTSHLFGRWSLHAAIYFTLSTVADADLATQFYQHLIDGTELSARHPAYLLREKLIAHRIAEAKLTANPYAGLVIKAWNIGMKRGTAKILKYSYQQENIPDIVTKKARQDGGLKFKDDQRNLPATA